MFAVCLIRPKYNGNVGGAFRAAENFGASAIIIASETHKTERTDVQRADRRVPTLIVPTPEAAILAGADYIAVERTEDATLLPDFEHPKRAVYVFGPEDSGISAAFRKRCAHTVRIPSYGSLNLAACVNIVLFDRTAQLGLPRRYSGQPPHKDPFRRRVAALREAEEDQHARDREFAAQLGRLRNAEGVAVHSRIAEAGRMIRQEGRRLCQALGVPSTPSPRWTR